MVNIIMVVLPLLTTIFTYDVSVCDGAVLHIDNVNIRIIAEYNESGCVPGIRIINQETNCDGVIYIDDADIKLFAAALAAVLAGKAVYIVYDDNAPAKPVCWITNPITCRLLAVSY
jgi:hypothetical protein